MTFKEFLESKPITDTPSGDFICDVLRSKDFPNDEQIYDRLLQYFSYQSRVHNTPEVILQFKKFWKLYTESLA